MYSMHTFVHRLSLHKHIQSKMIYVRMHIIFFLYTHTTCAPQARMKSQAAMHSAKKSAKSGSKVSQLRPAKHNAKDEVKSHVCMRLYLCTFCLCGYVICTCMRGIYAGFWCVY